MVYTFIATFFFFLLWFYNSELIHVDARVTPLYLFIYKISEILMVLRLTQVIPEVIHTFNQTITLSIIVT